MNAADPVATAKEDAEQKKRSERQARVARENAYRLSLYKQLRERVSVAGLSLPALREFAKAVVDEHDLDSSLHDLYAADVSTDLDAYIDNADAGALQLLLIDVILGRMLEIGLYDLMNDGSIDEDDGFATVVAMARHEGVDVDAVRAETFMPATGGGPSAPADDAPTGTEPVAGSGTESAASAIDVSNMQYDDLVEFIRTKPQQINELKDAVLACMPRYDLVGLLEQAATSQGYTHTTDGFVLAAVEAKADATPAAGEDAEDLAAQIAAAEVAKTPAKKSPGKAAKAKAKAPTRSAQAPVVKESDGAHAPVDLATAGEAS
jgi:hypothetical protein